MNGRFKFRAWDKPLEKYNITEKQFYGEKVINHLLFLETLKSIPEGFNPTVGRNLWLDGLKSIPKGFNPIVSGDLFLDVLQSIPEGFNPIVGGDLFLDVLQSIPEGFNPIVGGSLWLNGLKSLPEGFNPTVGGDLLLDSLQSIPEGFNPTVGGSLWLNGLQSIPEGFNPTVGGDLRLNGLKSLPEGFNPTVGGDLRLNGLKSLPEGFNPIVGGSLCLYCLKSIPKGFNPMVGESLYYDSFNKCIDIKTPNIEEKLVWKDGKYRVFDGIFCEVLEHKRNVYKVKIRGEISYVVSNGEFYSHGDTIKEAKESLIYKLSNRDCSEYKKWTLDTPITKEQAIKSYRAITGACEFGTRHFVESLDKKLRKLTPRKVIELTKGQYGSCKYKEFFMK